MNTGQLYACAYITQEAQPTHMSRTGNVLGFTFSSLVRLLYLVANRKHWDMPKKLSAKMLKLQTNPHADRHRPTLKDADERTFRNGLFRDPLSKSSSISNFTLDQAS